VKDHAAPAMALALLGRSRIASNLDQLAKAADLGVMTVSPMTDDRDLAVSAVVEGDHRRTAEVEIARSG